VILWTQHQEMDPETDRPPRWIRIMLVPNIAFAPILTPPRPCGNARSRGYTIAREYFLRKLYHVLDFHIFNAVKNNVLSLAFGKCITALVSLWLFRWTGTPINTDRLKGGFNIELSQSTPVLRTSTLTRAQPKPFCYHSPKRENKNSKIRPRIHQDEPS
jgi:hypothetical protein